MPDEPDDFEIERVGDTTVFRFRRRSILDEESVGWFGEYVFRLADTATRPRIVMDFGNVKFMSSAVLGKLLTLHRKVQAGGGWVKIRNLSPEVAEVFRLTKLDRLFGSDDDDDDDGGAGVPARVRPPAPSGSGAVALPPPPPDPE
ncbi:MAG: STAS domain-containing protein [Gemmataceae bacterium]